MNRRTVATMMCVLCLAVTLGLAGCTCVQKGAAIGAGAGAICGGLIGATDGEAGEGALIGAGGGGLVGALIGDGMCTPKLEDENANLKNQVAALTDENEKLKKMGPGACPQFVIQGDTLFASGSNVLTEQGKGILNSLAEKLRKDYPGRPLNIEGHTDDVPITYSGWKSNWELGAGRALSVLHYLMDVQHFDGTGLSAQTFSHYKPVKPNDSAENRQQNRRAVITVEVEK